MNQTTTGIEKLHSVSEEVNAGLTFDPRYGLDEHATLGNCYEFALRSHATLADTPGNHFIGYAYDHAFNVGYADGLYVVSSDVPGLAAHENVSPTLVEMLPEEILKAVAKDAVQSCVAAPFRMTAVDRAIRPEDRDRIHTFDRREWYEERWLRAAQPTGTIMEAGFAWDALNNYNALRRGLRHKEFEEIRDALDRLAVCTPQFETRPRYNEELHGFERAVRVMVRQSATSTDDLRRLVAAYQGTLPEKNTAANVVFADCYRAIGNVRKCPTTLGIARSLYERAHAYSKERRNRDNPLLLSKIDKIQPIFEQLAG